ncbi:MAG: tryptophan synthase subunit alpha [Gemmatimonadota bacterium]
MKLLTDPLAARFEAWRTAGHKALIPYLTAGFPTPRQTLDVMRAYARAGADIIELGVPFSDPVADGPTIQRASQLALSQGVTLDWCLDLLGEFRRGSDTAVVIFSYLNPVMSHGAQQFLADAVAAGAQGVLLTDLPLGGDPELESAFSASPLALVRLIAPSTTAERAREIARQAQGFLYYIARMGVTGARASLPAELGAQVAALREVTAVPIAVGFGISTPQQAAAVAQVADGVVVGSALVAALEQGIDGAEALLAGMRRAL